jgi:hypothetical protein
MGVPSAVWSLTIVGIAGLVLFDFVFHVFHDPLSTHTTGQASRSSTPRPSGARSR